MKITQILEQIPHSPHMSNILLYGITHLIFPTCPPEKRPVPNQTLSPLLRILMTKNPPLVILGFNHKNTVGRNHNMVHLRSAIFCRQQNIIQNYTLPC